MTATSHAFRDPPAARAAFTSVIVLVDSDAERAARLRDAMERAGYRVTWARCGAELFARAPQLAGVRVLVADASMLEAAARAIPGLAFAEVIALGKDGPSPEDAVDALARLFAPSLPTDWS